MALPNAILSRINTADDVSYDALTYVWFDKSLVGQVQDNGGGAAELIQNRIGRIAVADIIDFRYRTESGDTLTFIELVLNTDDTYSTPNSFINAEIADLEQQILDLQALLQP